MYFSTPIRPGMINMEPTHHPFRKENDLPNLQGIMLHVNLQGCKFRKKMDLFQLLSITWHSFGYQKPLQNSFHCGTRCLQASDIIPIRETYHHRSRLILTNGGFRHFYTKILKKVEKITTSWAPEMHHKCLNFQVFCFQEYPASCHGL